MYFYTFIVCILKVNNKEAAVVGCAFLLIGICFVYITDSKIELNFLKHTFNKQFIFRVGSFALAVLCVAVQARYMYSVEANSYVSEFHDRRSVNKTINKQHAVALKKSAKIKR